MNSPATRPTQHELEISLFGGGYGESVVLHLGADCWVVVDSCIAPDSEEPAALKYMRDMGTDPERSVKLIVITHWHKDHIRGMSQMVEECKGAKVVVSSAFVQREFLTMVSLHRTRAIPPDSGLDEFTRILTILDDRKQKRAKYNPPGMASSDKLLYREAVPFQNGIAEASIYSLSPSDTSVLLAQQDFAELTQRQSKRPGWLPPDNPNHSSVVLWVGIANERFLLGADIERTGSLDTGWTAILGQSKAIDGMASVFKVSHHGAESGDDPEVWSKLLVPKPYAILTGFNRGRILPTDSDVERITSWTPHAFITAPRASAKVKLRQKLVRETLNRTTRTVKYSQSRWGHVRLRRDIGAREDAWRLELFGNAVSLTTS